ncbi:hypothetical protein [Nocardiopsis sp. LOL_012]|uniref:hypothetical protein n=1 Tax=Nocardiopsis sp. LOL_012 TaxID=3345409 RepID=UPI003A83BEBA
MTDAAPDDVPVDLGPPQSPLVERLESGIGAVTHADRGPYAIENDAQAWRNAGFRAALRELSEALISGSDAELVGECSALSELLARPASESLVRALAHAPGHLLGAVLPALLSPKGRPAAEADAVEAWTVFTVCVDVLWGYVTGDGARTHRHVQPLVARTRFLALSEPFRHRGREKEWEPWWRSEDLKHLFGRNDNWVPLVRKTREAREVWRAHLDRYQALPLFDHAPPSAVEREVRALAFQDTVPERRSFCGGPLALSTPTERAGDEAAPWVGPPPSTTADRAVLSEAVEQHLLPRFAVVGSWSAVCGLYLHTRNGWALGGYVLVGAAVIIAVAAVALAAFTATVTFHWALGAIGFVYTLIVSGTVFFGRLWAMPLMLRLPAAGAVGLIVLVAFHPTWWEGVTLDWQLPLVLAGAAFGYLLVEVRNHNTGTASGDERRFVPGVLAGRALAVAVTGLVHSLFVAVIGMVAVTTVFGEDGDRLRGVWAGTSELGDPVAILIAAAFWCLAAGVFSQILWDDRPITAPLSHRRWRDER